MGTEGGLGAGWAGAGAGAGAGVGGDGTTAAGKGAGRSILNFRNMKATELWKLVLGVVSVAASDISVTIFFRPGRADSVFSISGLSTASGDLCVSGLMTLTGTASATDFFTLKSRATSSRREQGGPEVPSWTGRVPLQSLSWLLLVAEVESCSAVGSGVCTSR